MRSVLLAATLTLHGCASSGSEPVKNATAGSTQASPTLCAPVEAADLVVLQASPVPRDQDDPDAGTLLLIGLSWGQGSGNAIFFDHGRSVGRAPLDGTRLLIADEGSAWPIHGQVWGLGGNAIVSRLSKETRLRDELLEHRRYYAIKDCDPSQFFRYFGIDFEDDGVVDMEFGGRLCPDGAAHELRERTATGDWKVLMRSITPWYETEGPPTVCKYW